MAGPIRVMSLTAAAVVVATLFVAVTPIEGVAASCDAPWMLHDGNCYYFHNVTRTLKVSRL